MWQNKQQKAGEEKKDELNCDKMYSVQSQRRMAVLKVLLFIIIIGSSNIRYETMKQLT